MRRNISWNEEYPIHCKCSENRFGHFEMAVMDRIEGSAVNSYPLPQSFLC